jgi:hypothetical protein
MTENEIKYSTAHEYLRTHHPKTGRCEFCGKEGQRTEHALKRGRKYSKHRDDYMELCIRCHRAYDGNNPVAPHGEDCPNAKLTESIVREARVRYLAGESGRALAREFGVTQGTMQPALTGKTWAHVGI